MEQETATGQAIVVMRWNQEDPPDAAELYARLAADGHVPYLRGEPPGTHKRWHQHPFPEVAWVVSGWVRYTVSPGKGSESTQITLKAGDRIELRADLPHETEVMGSAYAVYLTVSPFALPIAHHPPGVNISPPGHRP